VRATTIRQLAATFAAQPSGILYPTFAGRRGHPPLIARSILAETAQQDASGSLRSLLALHESSASEVPVADEAIQMDMDTPADYAALLDLASRHNVPTAAECEAILATRHVEQATVRHMHKVAEVAHGMAAELVRSGFELSFELVNAAALLHDLAKGQPDHASAGASILRTMEFPEVAAIVAAHTDLVFESRLDERAIVYLADKLVCGDTEVTIAERFQPALDRFGNDPSALHAAQSRKDTALAIAHAVATRLQLPLSSVTGVTCDSVSPPSGPLIASEVVG
jgi:putative nucleotidyltransferase with HDIG domain